MRVHVSGIDLVRDEAGDFRVLEDNLRSPSGVSYVITNRAAMSQVLPELFADHRIQPVADYPSRLLAALKASAPTGVADPTVVVLTPGVYNSAYFEHALLARQMGVELVEGRDLICAGNQVSMRTTDGQQRVDVIYRRIDDEFLDPVHFRPDSVIGCAGVLNAARAGRVTIANAVGNGVADDKLLFTWVPDLIRYYLGEEPVLQNAETHRLDDEDTVEWVLESLDQLVLKPVDGSGGKGIVIGPRADEKTLAELAVKVRATAARLDRAEADRAVHLPTLIGGRIAPRHVDLRPFAVNDGDKVWVLPGGLTRVALPEGELVVNSSQGGGSKDTWVLSPPRQATEPERARPDDDRVHRRRPARGPARAGSRAAQRHRRRPVPAAAAGPGRACAEPHRRVAVLDRPLRGARRRHRPHPRRAHPAAGRGPVDRRAPGLRQPARAHGLPDSRRGGGAGGDTAGGGHRARPADARLRPHQPELDRRCAVGGPGERPRRPRGAAAPRSGSR